MSAGRTSWFPRDAAWHRRELIVELGEEFGPSALAVLDVLDAWAQEQRDSGVLKGGFRTLARESFVTVRHGESPAVHARAVVERAAALGVLDDLELADDGRRFTCRVSGWQSDNERGRAALRQAAKRNREADSTEQTVTDRDVSRDVTPSPLPHQNRTEKERECGDAPASASPIAAEAIAILRQCDRLHVDPVGVENAIAAWPGQDPIAAARTAVSWATDPAFRNTNGAKVLGDVLSKQQLAAKRESERPAFQPRRPAQQQASAEDFFKIARGEA